MSKKITDLTQLVTNDVRLGMTEVVNVFISQYETDLITKKDEVQTLFVDKNKEIKGLNDSVINSVKHLEQQTIGNEMLKLKIKHSSTIVDWEKERVEITFKLTSPTETYGSLSAEIQETISRNDVSAHTLLISELSELSEELSRLKGLLRDVNRKERQVRGEISKRQLQDSGYSDLINDPKIMKLCNF